MKHIYDKHKLIKLMTIDDLLVSNDTTHEEYRQWLASNKLPMYPMTKGLYEEALVSDDPLKQLLITRSELNKVLYSKGWIEPRKCKTQDIIKALKDNPNYSQEYIAYSLGVTQARVSQVSKKFKLRPERKRRTHIPNDKIKELRHLDPRDIAKKLDISISSVYKGLAKCKNT